MRKNITILFLSLLQLVFVAFTACAADDGVSRDVELSDGDWTVMAKRYPNPYASADTAEAPSPEMLASWWDSLGDETLTALIMMSLNNNRDMASARAKVTEARAALGINKAAVLPWLDSTDSWTRARTSANSTGTGQAVSVYRLGLDASWEIDIFGGRRQDIKAGTASLEAQYAALHNSWVSLSSEVAINYLSLRTLQERLSIAEANLALQEDNLDMLQSQYDSGLADALALSQAQYTYAQTKASIPTLRTSIEQSLNAMAILTGAVPGSLEAALGEPKPLPVPDSAESLVGIPADYLRQRPDIRMAERQFIAQIARTKSARADMWPKITFVGSIGLESISTGSLISGGSRAFSFGPVVTLPIFHAGAIRNNIRVQSARQEQYLVAYEQTVLNAVAEVRDSLTANAQERLRNDSLRDGAEAALTAYEVASDKYKNGLTDFFNVIDAQRSLLSLQESLAISDGQVLSNLVGLYKALGGGWAPIVAENNPDLPRIKK